MGIGFASTWLRRVSPPPLLRMTTLTTDYTFSQNHFIKICRNILSYRADRQTNKDKIITSSADVGFMQGTTRECNPGTRKPG